MHSEREFLLVRLDWNDRFYGDLFKHRKKDVRVGTKNSATGQLQRVLKKDSCVQNQSGTQ